MNKVILINEAIAGLDCVQRIFSAALNSDLSNHGIKHLINAKVVLGNTIRMINTIEGKKILAESGRDSLLLAIAGTDEGRVLDVTKPEDAIQQAMVIIRTMDADIRTSREAEEIPFGAVEQDHERMQLEQRLNELEMLFELRMVENDAVINQLREYQSRWLSLINLINRISPDSLNDTQARHEQ